MEEWWSDGVKAFYQQYPTHAEVEKENVRGPGGIIKKYWLATGISELQLIFMIAYPSKQRSLIAIFLATSLGI